MPSPLEGRGSGEGRWWQPRPLPIWTAGDYIQVKVVLPDRLKPVLPPLPSNPEIAWYTDTDSGLAALPGAEAVWVHFGLTDLDAVLKAGTGLNWVPSAATGLEAWPVALLRARNVALPHGAGVA